MKKDFTIIGSMIFILSLIIPAGTMVVEPLISFAFLVVVLLVIAPISFVIVGYTSAKYYKKIISWFVPFLCVLFWTSTNYLIIESDILYYLGFYIAISYFSMVMTILMVIIKDKIKR